jgi:hypothetical protein
VSYLIHNTIVEKSLSSKLAIPIIDVSYKHTASAPTLCISSHIWHLINRHCWQLLYNLLNKSTINFFFNIHRLFCLLFCLFCPRAQPSPFSHTTLHTSISTNLHSASSHLPILTASPLTFDLPISTTPLIYQSLRRHHSSSNIPIRTASPSPTNPHGVTIDLCSTNLQGTYINGTSAQHGLWTLTQLSPIYTKHYGGYFFRLSTIYFTAFFTVVTKGLTPGSKVQDGPKCTTYY